MDLESSHQDTVSSPTRSTNSIFGGNPLLSPTICSSNSSATSLSSPSPTTKVKSLTEIYERTANNNCANQVFNYTLMSSINLEPRVLEDATKQQKWHKAMDKEIAAIEINETWKL